MPTNNPTPQTSSGSGSRIGTEHSSSLEGRVERGSERVERGIEQLATTAADRVREAREQATSGLTEQRDMVAQRIRRIGGILRAGGESLATDDALAHNILDLTSDRVEWLADYVSEVTPSMLSEDLQRVARRRPGLFFGGAFLLGLAVGRFVRASTGGGGRGQEEFDIDLEDDTEYSASRYERPYPGRPLSSASPTSDAASPGTGATASYGAPASPPRPYTNNPVPPVPASTSTSPSSAPSYGTRPSQSSLSGSAAGSGTLPPPYGGGTGGASSTPVRTQSTSPVSNAATNDPNETQRGQGAKS